MPISPAISPARASLTGLASLWRADRMDVKTSPDGYATGFAALDAELPDHGWPRAGMVELLGSHDLGAEWSLLTPWLRRPVCDAGPILCLTPQHEPNAPALFQLGLPVDRLLLVRATTAADAAWAGEQALQIMSCQAIIWWVCANFKEITPVILRRLHLSSVTRPTPVFVLGPSRSLHGASPAPLRLKVEQAKSKLVVTVIKRRGPPMNQPIEIDHPAFRGVLGARLQATETASPNTPRRVIRHITTNSAVDAHGLARPVPANLAARGC